MTALETRELSTGYPLRGGKMSTVSAKLNITIHPGELVCLLGPNGAGKSTLIRTLTGMQDAIAGEVLLGGRDLTGLTPRDVSRSLSVVLTDRVNVGTMTAYSLVALGRHPYTNWLGQLEDGDHEVVQASLREAGAADLASRYVSELSDGERQKVMIARALAQEPEVMVLDEPTAFLDLPRRVELMRLLRRLAHEKSRAVLCSTHDLDLALASADRLLLLRGDGTVEMGAPEDLVLSNAFERTFENEEVDFDVNRGAFIVHTKHGGRIRLEGEGVRAVWTQKALERAGYDIVDDSSVTTTVKLVCDGWLLGTAEGEQHVGCLHELVDRVRLPHAEQTDSTDAVDSLRADSE